MEIAFEKCQITFGWCFLEIVSRFQKQFSETTVSKIFSKISYHHCKTQTHNSLLRISFQLTTIYYFQRTTIDMAGGVGGDAHYQ